MIKKYIVPVKYSKLEKPQLFTTDIDGLQIDDKVVVNSDRGVELGKVVDNPTNIESFPNVSDISTIVAKANDSEIRLYNENNKRAKEAIQIASEEANNLKLEMNFLFAEYTLDASKIIITYTAEGRIDFRELLKVLAGRLHTRIEFKQIGPRDKARSTGGVGSCGRELCCIKFLKNFDGISINRAKNQQLSLNAQKLSGSCGKLKCCLLFEDDAYTKESKAFPTIGSIIKFNNKDYKVLGFNIISRDIKCMGEEGLTFINLKDLKNK